MIPTFKMLSLLQMCLKRVSMLLKKGTWNRLEKNPFSSMPGEIIDNLMEFLLLFPNFIRPSDLRLILQSGQLSRLDLSTLLIDEENHLLLSWMTADTCRNLRTLSVRHALCDESGAPIVTDILQRCHNLEEFHSKLILDMNALINCNHLKNLRLHLEVPLNAISEDFYHKAVAFSRSKQNLEEFSFCNLNNGFIAYKSIAVILVNCPKLISIGFTDSLEALHYIRSMKGMVKFNLQRCLWGINEGDVPSTMRLPKTSSYSEKFPDAVRNAVNMCPAVEILVINVYHEEALEHLIKLRKLRSLSLKFNYFNPDNVITLIFLLREIGPFLEHLSLEIEDLVPVEIICTHCYNLKTLQICGSLVRKDSREDFLKQLLLERLYIWKADCKSLVLLLRHSPNLIELYLGETPGLDDELVGKILSHNFTFPNLTTVGIRECPLLSKDGMNRLLTSAPNLKEIFFGSREAYKHVHEVILQKGLRMLHYLETFKLKRREYYVYRPDPCIF